MENILAKFQAEPMDVERVKREGWERDRILVVCANDQRLSALERAFVEQLAKRIYSSAHKN